MNAAKFSGEFTWTNHDGTQWLKGKVKPTQSYSVELPGAFTWWQHALAFLGVRKYWTTICEFDGEMVHEANGEARIQLTSPVSKRHQRPLLWRGDLGL